MKIPFGIWDILVINRIHKHLGWKRSYRSAPLHKKWIRHRFSHQFSLFLRFNLGTSRGLTVPSFLRLVTHSHQNSYRGWLMYRHLYCSQELPVHAILRSLQPVGCPITMSRSVWSIKKHETMGQFFTFWKRTN